MGTEYRRCEGAPQSVQMRSRLRQVTAGLHRSAESHFGLQSRTWDRPTYRAMLERLWGFYAPLEHALMQVDWHGSGITMDLRCKRAWLEADILFLGAAPEDFSRLETCRDLPSLKHGHDGLGALYVVEGSTLGGQIILRSLQDTLAISPIAGGRFFASYGRNIGAMWRGYLDVLEDVALAPVAAHAVERAAMKTFTAFDCWLEEGAAP